MTANGETVTPKENLFDSYLVIPGKDNFLEGVEANMADLQDWVALSAHNYVLYFESFHFAHYRFSEPLPFKTKVKASEDLVVMHFCLEGNCGFSADNSKRSITFRNSEHNIISIPKDQKLVFSYTDPELEIVNIYFEKEFLLKYIPKNHLLADKIADKLLGVVQAINLTISPKMQIVIQDIINCEFEGHLKKLYTQAKIIELLTLQLAQFEEEPAETLPLKQVDVDKMVLVKELIELNLDEPLSLSYLARYAGTNEQYLKKHFKMMFGSTVFNYILSLRMERAKNMLLEGNHKIADVARVAGYKHPTHFSGAFKKFFGYVPNKIKFGLLFISSELMSGMVYIY
jgi:AraC-like DNA-binding protein